MQREEVIEGNKLIAEFMGGIYSKHAEAWGLGENVHVHPKPIKHGSKICEGVIWAERFETELKYDTSWDWLIPVIDKITSDYTYQKYKEYTCNMFDDGGIYINTKYIDVTYNNVVEFIKWYNENYQK